MWRFSQRRGDFIRPDGSTAAVGYAGNGLGKNNPEMQHVQGVGPLPRGRYRMRPPINTPTHGPYVIWLDPAPTNEMFGRSAFGIHGDSVKHPGTASLGCVCVARAARVEAWESGDHELEVVE